MLKNLVKQSIDDCYTSDCPPTIFFTEENMSGSFFEEDESIIPINAQKGPPHFIPFVQSDDTCVNSNYAPVIDTYNPDKPAPENI